MASRRPATHRWSQRVTQTSNAMDLEPGVFTLRDPRVIARSLKRSVEASDRLKSTPFRSAMSMLTFFVNRAGRGLPPARRRVLERAKDELRALYGKPVHNPPDRSPSALSSRSSKPRSAHQRRK